MVASPVNGVWLHHPGDSASDGVASPNLQTRRRRITRSGDRAAGRLRYCTRTYGRRSVMMNSRWAGFMGVAVGAMAMGLVLRAEAVSSEDQRLHVAAAPADYATLGIGQKVAIWEDGRRTPKSADTFEWWDFDGLLDDGTVVVVWFGDNWFFGSP